MPHCKVLQTYVGPLNDAMDEFEIDTPRRAAAFLAQIAHETLQLRFTKEIWGPTAQQLKYERRVDKAWPPEGADQANHLAWILGNSELGDGRKFMGRGPIQTTGRTNYDHAGTALNLDLLNQPELLETPQHGCRAAALFWKRHGLNALADEMRFDEITKAINGAQTGASERRGYFETALAALGEPAIV
jgi:putative chitinase